MGKPRNIHGALVKPGVPDGGIGLPPGEPEKVLGPHHRVRPELFASVRGAGLGLTFVREVLRRLVRPCCRLSTVDCRLHGLRLRVPLEG